MAGEQTRFRTGNLAARKYTLEDARRIFGAVLAEIREDETIVYLNTAVNRLDYYPQLLTYLLNIYGEDEEVVEYSDRIKGLLEERIVLASLGARVKEATAIFVMKARFGMHETQHIHTTSGEVEVESAGEMQTLLDNASPEQLEEMRDLFYRIKRNADDQPPQAQLGAGAPAAG